MSLFGKKKSKPWKRYVVCRTKNEATHEASEARKEGLESKIGYAVYTRKKK